MPLGIPLCRFGGVPRDPLCCEVGGILVAGATGHPRGTPGGVGSPPGPPCQRDTAGVTPRNLRLCWLGYTWLPPWGSRFLKGFLFPQAGLGGSWGDPFSWGYMGGVWTSPAGNPLWRGPPSRQAHAAGWRCPGLSPQNKGSEDAYRHTLSLTLSFCLPLISPAPWHLLTVRAFLKAHPFGGEHLHAGTKGTRTLESVWSQE